MMVMHSGPLCSFCIDTPATAVWHSAKIDVWVCCSCAKTILPKLLADAVVRDQTRPDRIATQIEQVWEKESRANYYEGCTLALAVVLRGSVVPDWNKFDPEPEFATDESVRIAVAIRNGCLPNPFTDNDVKPFLSKSTESESVWDWLVFWQGELVQYGWIREHTPLGRETIFEINPALTRKE
jgi:hypothetical protein